MAHCGVFEYTLKTSGRRYCLSQQMGPEKISPLFSDEWTGSQVWDCSLHLAEFIESSLQKGCLDLQGRRVVELGSGCGLCAIVAASHGAYTVATDQSSIVGLIQHNANINLNQDECNLLTVQELNWGSKEDLDSLQSAHGTTFDAILISDCLNPIYGEESYKALADTVTSLSHSGTFILLAYQVRGLDVGGLPGTESTGTDPLKAFFGFLSMYSHNKVWENEALTYIYELTMCKT
eukprot:gnl/MRDRNA2_/MRDRNA2_101543_c0_seq1.p1 gnl/MRDRNA2_/MRDRNA2_101543_c0~~gnl/MRDRNA2_/MRDRNA2_101543_c0_seq1.p1  ORF type:complete len:235 (+),score=35.92 gnl/MRDRNA2_/MRDRNA2_101543_c0_seq1:210-914(+)